MTDWFRIFISQRNLVSRRLHTSLHSPDGGQLPLEEEVVGLVVEAPLADGERGAGVLHLRDHLVKLLDLVLAQLPVVLGVRHVQLVLRLRLGRLERAGQDGEFHVFELLKWDTKFSIVGFTFAVIG